MKQRLPIIGLLVLFAALTLYPALGIVFNFPSTYLITPLATLAGFSFAVWHAKEREGWKRALIMLGMVFGVSLLFECVGVATGLVYGPYHYTDSLGPKFLGLVPVLIPVAWFMMSYPSFIIADWLVPKQSRTWLRNLTVAAVGAVVMTAWDVVMDPIMVSSGHWVWEVEGAYFGIPLQNYVGWLVTVFTAYGLYLLVVGRIPQPQPPTASEDRLAVVSYTITAFGMVFALFAAGAGQLGLIGVFVMAPWIIAGLLRLNHAVSV
ncbi:MAG TPA: carotenoid biosynthesis protein [Longilinea sp.]|nr:carotenoid biosynthesis protein [Longilinea sp.]